MTRLVDATWIAERTGLSRRYVLERLTKHPSFPRPRVDVSPKMRRWAEDDIEAWIGR